MPEPRDLLSVIMPFHNEQATLASIVSQVLSQPIPEPEIEARVVINERAGSVVFSGDVEIGAVVVHHKNVIIEAGTNAGRFTALEPERKSQQGGTTKLQALLERVATPVAVNPDVRLRRVAERRGWRIETW